MNSYLIIFIGWIIGQIVHAARESWKLQARNENLKWWDAFKIYIHKGQGAFIFGMSILLVVLFIFPDVIGSVTGDSDKEIAKWKVWIVERLRIVAVLLGFFGQGAGYLLTGMGDKTLEAVAKKKGVELKPKE